MRASLLTVGDELLIGQVVDTNAAWIAAAVDEHGGELARKLTCGDAVGAIAESLAAAATGVDVVLVTGGLGPTTDDLTLEAIARYADRELEFRPEVFARIERIFREIIKRPMSPGHRRQAMLPAGSEVLPNSQGTAPGVWLDLGPGAPTVIAMPGVPREMKAIMREAALPRLAEAYPGARRLHLTLLTAGWGETQIESAITPALDDAAAAAGLSVAYLPGLGRVRLRLSAKPHAGESPAATRARLGAFARAVEALLPPGLVYGRGTTELVAVVHEHLRERGWVVATAESCTGGRLAHLLVEEAGASDVFHGGVVAYDNAVKIAALAVAPATLRTHGAVSEATVTEMVAGARARFGAEVAVATSGIAGPTGGTPDKPVGTVWIAVGDAERTVARQLSLGRDRATNIAYSANAALDLLRRFLQGFA